MNNKIDNGSLVITNKEFYRVKGILTTLYEKTDESNFEIDLEEKFSIIYKKLYNCKYNPDIFYFVLNDMQKEFSENDVVKFKNESTFDFTDISSEEYRIYEFNNGKTVMITEPLKLSVSKSGGHRIYDNAGISHYIPQGWLHLSWRSKPGKPNFVK